jgi:hypothetical protein
MRPVSLVAGAALVALAFAASVRVADTREGLIAEVVTLLAGLAGVGLLIYGLTFRRGARAESSVESESTPRSAAARPRAARDLLLGSAGIALALVLVFGLAVTGGPLLAAFGLALLLPMLGGSVYLCVRFLRANP